MLGQRSFSLALLAVLVVLAASCYGRRFSRCELARELVWKGLPRYQIGDWVCLVEAESSSNTAAVGPPNTDGSRDHGLFQINDRYWCEASGNPGKECKMRCSDLENDDITDDVNCVKRIFNVHGFAAWTGWKNKCQGFLPDVSGCF